MNDKHHNKMQIDVFAPSQQLKVARENLGLSQEDVARTLRIRLEFIKNLDEGEFNKIPNMTYTRGYIRAYAKLVGLSGDEMIDLFNEEQPESDMADVHSVTHEPIGSANMTGPVVKTSLVGLTVLTVIAALVWWSARDNGIGPINLSNVQPSEPSVSSDRQPTQLEALLSGISGRTDGDEESESSDSAAPDNEAPFDNGTAAETSTDNTAFIGRADIEDIEGIEGIEGAATSPATSPAQQPEEDAPPAQQPEEDTPPAQNLIQINVDAGGPDKVVLRFSGQCWVEISDRHNDELYSELHLASEVLTVHGTAPMLVLLGNASVVRMTYNDSPFDVTPFINRSQVANITLTE